MFLLNWMKRIRSYNIVSIQTEVPEKILNLMQINGVAAWDIRYEKGELSFKISNHEIEGVNAMISRFGTHITVARHLGAQRAFDVVRQRKAFFIVALFVFIAFTVFSRFIWSVEINGARELKAEDIRMFLYENGIKQTDLKSAVDTNAAEVLLLRGFEQLSDADVSIQGTKLIVTVVERESPIAIYDKNIPVDLVATQDGVVDELVVYNGTAAVSVGDTVAAGDLLISGAVEFLYKETPGVSHVHAMGKVLTYGTEEFDELILNRYEPREGAMYETQKTFYLFGRSFSVNNAGKGEDLMYIEEKNKVLTLGWIELPILYDEIKWYNINNCQLKSDEALSQEVYDWTEEKLSGKCTIRNLTYRCEALDNYRVKVHITAQCAYNLAVEREIAE
mgnify:CR=1 FL=1